MGQPSRAREEPGIESGETVVSPLPAPRSSIARATHFRSTWIVSSLEGIRNGGYFDRYRALLAAHHEEILSCMAGLWMPMAIASEHYRACEALGLSDAQHAAMIQGEGGRTRQAWFSSLITAAEQADATPWTILPLLNRMWLRSADGGAVGVFRLGPTRARVEYVGCELFDIGYFLRATGWTTTALASRVCEKPTLRILPATSPGEGHYLIEWDRDVRRA